MKSPISRRGVISTFGLIAAGLAGRTTAIFPEFGQALRPSGLPALRDAVIDEYTRDQAARAVSEAIKDTQVRDLWRALEGRGLRAMTGGSYGAKAHFRQWPGRRGDLLVIPFADAAEARAKLYYAHDLDGGPKIFAVTATADPAVSEFYVAEGGKARRLSVASMRNGEVTVARDDGEQRSARIPDRSVRGRGLAAPMRSCPVDQASCEIICAVGEGLVCWYETSVVCAGAVLICGPCGIICEVVSVVMCAVVITVSCSYVCQPC